MKPDRVGAVDPGNRRDGDLDGDGVGGAVPVVDGDGEGVGLGGRRWRRVLAAVRAAAVGV